MQIEYKQILARLYPPVSYNINGERFLAQCEVGGNAFDRVQQSAVDNWQAVEHATRIAVNASVSYSGKYEDNLFYKF